MQVRDNYKLRIFLIDNEPIAIETLQALLTDLGHEVITFNSSNNLFENSGKAPHFTDLILIEPNMPTEEADKVISEIHQLYPEADIIVMTDYAPVISSKKSISDGVYACLNKPFRLVELELLVRLLSEGRADFRYIPHVTKNIG